MQPAQEAMHTVASAEVNEINHKAYLISLSKLYQSGINLSIQEVCSDAGRGKVLNASLMHQMSSLGYLLINKHQAKS